MLFTTPEQVLVLAVVLLGGWLLGYASAPDAKKWKRRAKAQADSFTAYHYDAEDKVRAAQQRAGDLKAENDALRADQADAERTIAGLRAAAAAPPASDEPMPVVTAPVMVVSEPAAQAPPPPPLALVEPTPPPAPEATPEPAETDVSSSWLEPHEPNTVQEDAVAAPEGVPATPGATFPPEPEIHAESTAPAPAAAETAAPPEAAALAGVTPEPEFAQATTPLPIGPASSEPPSKGWFGTGLRDDLTRIRGIDGVLNTRLFALGVVRFEDIEKLSAEDEMALEQRLAVPVGLIEREQWRTQASLLRDGLTEAHAARFGVSEPVGV